jgi:DNA topoisomerase-2
MPIWSLTVERLDKLRAQIAGKKAEHDELDALSEKDLWCNDLDDFVAEWENQLRLDAEIQTTIRRMGRRVSKKIGAGKGRRPRDDEDYAEKKPARGPATKVVAKVETKTHQRFAEMFAGKPKPKPKTTPLGSDGPADEDSDDDFALLGKTKPATQERAVKTESVASDAPANGRVKRAAASKAKAWVIEDDDDDDRSESDDDDKMLGDVGAMVKGIGSSLAAPAASANTGRLSLFAMSRPDSSHGSGAAATSSAAHRLKTKPSRTFDLDDHDETNYEMLAKSSPQKAPAKADDVDAFLSDEDDLPLPSKLTTMTTTAKASSVAAKSSKLAPLSGGAAVKKARAPAAAPAAKSKGKAVAAAPKPVHLSPAAKAYAAKKAKETKVKKDAFGFSDDDDDDDDDVVMQERDPSPAPQAKPRGRPARAAATTAKAKKPIYIDDDDDEDEDDSMAVDDEDESGGDDFDMDESDY